MARVGYCKHGTYIGPYKEAKTIEIEIDGKMTTMESPGTIGCFQCKLEQDEAARKKEQEAAYFLSRVKNSLLALLKENEEFREEVKKILNS